MMTRTRSGGTLSPKKTAAKQAVTRRRSSYFSWRGAAFNGWKVNLSGLLQPQPRFMLIGALLCLSVTWALHWTLAPGRLPITLEIVFTADVRHYSNAAINATLSDLRSEGLLYFQHHAVRAALNGLPWIRRIRLSHHWPPGKVRLQVDEYTALGLWQKPDQSPCPDGGVFCTLLSKQGEIFSVAAVTVPAGLPLLSGSPQQATSLARHYPVLRDLCTAAGFYLEFLTQDPDGAWEARLITKLNQEIIVQLGNTQTEKRLRRFFTVYPVLLQDARDKPIRIVDLRYTGGIVVK